MKKLNALKLASAVAFSFAAIAAQAAPTFSLGYGDTSVKLDPIFTGALQSLNVTPGALGRTHIVNGTAFFPIADGDFDFGTAKGEIAHFGGLSLKAGATFVELRDFIIDTSSKPVLTGKVVVNDSFVARIPLFDLELPALTLPLATPRSNYSPLQVPGVKVSLNATAAAALNQVFGVTAFSAGIPIGQAKVNTYAIRH
jgi:hypothetical protein